MSLIFNFLHTLNACILINSFSTPSSVHITFLQNAIYWRTCPSAVVFKLVGQNRCILPYIDRCSTCFRPVSYPMRGTPGRTNPYIFTLRLPPPQSRVCGLHTYRGLGFYLLNPVAVKTQNTLHGD